MGISWLSSHTDNQPRTPGRALGCLGTHPEPGVWPGSPPGLCTWMGRGVKLWNHLPCSVPPSQALRGQFPGRAVPQPLRTEPHVVGHCPVQAGLGDRANPPSSMPTSARARHRQASVPQNRDWTDRRMSDGSWGDSEALESARSRAGQGSTSLSKPSRAPWRRRGLGWDLEDKETLSPAEGHRQGGQTGVGRDDLGQVSCLSHKTPPPPAETVTVTTVPWACAEPRSGLGRQHPPSPPEKCVSSAHLPSTSQLPAPVGAVGSRGKRNPPARGLRAGDRRPLVPWEDAVVLGGRLRPETVGTGVGTQRPSSSGALGRPAEGRCGALLPPSPSLPEQSGDSP